jgi:hypothetical protein
MPRALFDDRQCPALTNPQSGNAETGESQPNLSRESTSTLISVQARAA